MYEEQKGNIREQKKRVRAQQNVITALCMACLAFCISWSVYAASSNDEIKPASAEDTSSAAEVKKDDSSKTDDKFPNEVSSSKAEGQNSSGTDDESSLSQKDKDTETFNDDLSDTLFLGDSRTVGLRNSTDKPKATFYCAVGLHIDTVLTANDVNLGGGKTGSVVNALKERQFKRIYINFGTNELGWPYINVFKEKYSEVLKKLKTLQPKAKIYAQSILPVTAAREAKGDAINNNNVNTFNEQIKAAAAENDVTYIDCTPAVAGADGKLPANASTDGIHLNAEYCLKWQNYLINNTQKERTDEYEH